MLIFSRRVIDWFTKFNPGREVQWRRDLTDVREYLGFIMAGGAKETGHNWCEGVLEFIVAGGTKETGPNWCEGVLGVYYGGRCKGDGTQLMWGSIVGLLFTFLKKRLNRTMIFYGEKSLNVKY